MKSRIRLWPRGRWVWLALATLVGCLEPFPAQPTLPQGAGSTRAAAGAGAGHARRAPVAAAAKDQAAAPAAQSEAEAWRLICEAEQRAGVAPSTSRGERAGQVAEWIVAHVSNQRARLWWVELGKIERQQQPQALAAAAARAGVRDCRLAALLFGELEPAAAAPGADGGAAPRRPPPRPPGDAR